MQPKQVIVTCFSGISDATNYSPDPNGYVLAQYDTRNPLGDGALPGQHWVHLPSFVNHNDPPAGSPGNEWTAENLGEIFGVTLGDGSAPDIFVSSSTIYALGGPAATSTGPAGFGGVYRISGTNGDIEASESLPNDGRVGLGNLCFHRPSDGTPLLYVSNFEDGLIYRLDSSGAMSQLSTFDHGLANSAADSGTPGLTAIGRRIWGVKVFQGRLYYSVWNTYNDSQTPGPGPAGGTPNSIWSVEINPVDGDFVSGSEYKEFDLTSWHPTAGSSNPVASIEFSDSGKMFIAERYTHFEGAIHTSRVLEYTGSTTAWVEAPAAPGGLRYEVGTYFNPSPGNIEGPNSTGGVAADCDDNLWVMGDALRLTPGNRIYGLQSIAAGGNQSDTSAIANSVLIDLDGNLSQYDKRLLGSLDLFDPCSCLALDGQVHCPTEAGGDYSFDFTVTNTSGQIAHSMILHPVSGTTGISPSTVIFDPPLGDGDSRSFTGFDLEGVTPGGTACFRVVLLTNNREVCCSDEVCVDIPECECFEVIEQVVECDSTGKVNVTLTIRNYESYPLAHGYVTVGGALAVTPDDYIEFDPQIPPFGTGTISFTLCNVLPGELACFNLSVHSEDWEECCWKEICVRCEDDNGGGEPTEDRCDVTREVVCDPAIGLGTITLTIYNNGPTPENYFWNVDFLAPSGLCPVALSPSDFTPSSGSQVIPPFSSANITLTVACDKLFAGNGSCANYGIQVCDAALSNCFACRGVVKNEPFIGVLQGAPGPFPIQVEGQQELSLRLTNTTSRDSEVEFEVSGLAGWLLFSQDGGIDKSTPMLAKALVRAGETVDIPITVFLPSPGEDITRSRELPITVAIRPEGGGGHTIDAVFIVEEPQQAPLIEVTDVSCVQIQQVGWQVRLDCNVGALAVTHVERSTDLISWTTVAFATEAGNPLELQSIEVGPGPTSYFLGMTAPRYFYRVVAVSE